MKLQLALDDLSLEQAIALAERVRDHIDIIEAGGFGVCIVAHKRVVL